MDTDIELIDLMDTLNHTLSVQFLDKWRFKYGERLIRLFQMKVLNSLKDQKQIKLENLYKYLNKDSGFSSTIVLDFLKDIDYECFYPIITGNVKSLSV